MSALVKNLRLLQAWYLPAGPEPEEAMPSKYRAFKEAADTIESLSAQVAAEHARAERAEAEVAKLKVHAEAMANADKIEECERLLKTLNDHLESEAAETMRANRAEAEVAKLKAERAALLADRPDVVGLVAHINDRDPARYDWETDVAMVAALESLAAQLAEVKKSATAWQGEYERVVAQLAEAQKVLKAAEERARRAEEDAGALREALDCLVCIVGLTAFKHPAQRAVLQEAIDAAIKVLRCPAIDAARAAK